MKAILATASVIITLLGSRLTAAEATPAPAPAAISVEQQFQQADIQLALEQYKKLRMAAFDISLKLQTDRTQSDEQRKQLQETHSRLEVSADRLRAETLKNAAVAVANAR